MKLYKKLILLLYIFPQILVAQLEPKTNEIGVSLMTGVSYMYDKYHLSYYRPSALAGIYHRYKINNKTYVGMEFSLVHLEGKHKVDGRQTVSENLDYYHYYSHSTMAGFAFLIGWDIFMFSLDVKPQAYVILINNGTRKGYDGDDVSETMKIRDYFENKYDFGLRLDLNYQINKKLLVSASFFHSVAGFYQHNYPHISCLARQATIGIKYSIIRTQ